MAIAIALYEVSGLLLTDDELAAMRQWLDDFTWIGLDGLTPTEIAAAVEECYVGGPRAFLASLQNELEW
jgi:hypothetical protein